jgi:hypothetical protein
MGWVPRKPQARIIDGEAVAKSGRGPMSALGGVILTVGRRLPVYPYQQTSSEPALESLGDCGQSLPTLRLSELRRAWAQVTFGQFPAPILSRRLPAMKYAQGAPCRVVANPCTTWFALQNYL